MPTLSKYIRIFFACIGAYFIASFISTHYFANPNQFDTVALKSDVDAIITSVTTFHLEIPRIRLFSERIESPSPTPEEPYPTPVDNTLPMETTSPPSEAPTSTPYIQPTWGITYPTVRPPSPVPTKQVTSAPQPTKKPKPTKAPDIFPIDPNLKRPGETVDELFTIAAQKACIPKAALRAIASIESGGFFDTVIPKYLLLYNSYNWWNSEFITEEKRLCSGYAYDMNTGLVPSDSKYAGYKCREGSGSGLAVMGCMASSPREFDLYKGLVAKALGVSVAQVDRRVILDSLILTGFAIQKEVHAGSCTSWSASEMVKGACSYYGSCGFKDGTYYCNTFCRNLKTYGGGDCSGAIAKYKDSCWQ